MNENREENLQQNIEEDVENSNASFLEPEVIENTEGLQEDNISENQEPEPNYSFEYNTTAAESEFGIKRFYRRYFVKNAIIYTVVLSIFALLFIKPIMIDYTNIFAWAMLGVCVALIIEIWARPKLNRKKVLEVIKTMNKDKYICSVYDDYLKISTIIPPEELENGERIENPKPRIINFKTELVEIEDFETVFIIFDKKQTTFIIPKRCMDKEISSKFGEMMKQSCEERYSQPVSKKDPIPNTKGKKPKENNNSSEL